MGSHGFPWVSVGFRGFMWVSQWVPVSKPVGVPVGKPVGKYVGSRGFL